VLEGPGEFGEGVGVTHPTAGVRPR
jgi:hypothetical protein